MDKIYVVSDIHGNLNAVHELYSKLKMHSRDKLYVLGDVIDRNPYGITIMKDLMKRPNVRFLLGNHEWMMMRALGFPRKEDTTYNKFRKEEYMDLWFYNGGRQTYREWARLSSEEKMDIKDWLLTRRLEFDVKTKDNKFKLVHAAPMSLYDKYKDFIESQDALEFGLWDRNVFTLAPNVDDSIVIFGHTITGNFTNKYRNCVITPFFNKDENGLWIDIDCGAGLPYQYPRYVPRIGYIELNTLTIGYSNRDEVTNLSNIMTGKEDVVEFA